ncbi:MAG: c-type cytochrome [Methylophilaceae bacterium]
MPLNKSISVLRYFSFTAFVLLPISASIAAEINAPSHQEKIHIRTLAASCAACHGTQGNSLSITPVLAGLDAAYFSTQMIAYKNGEHSRTSTVMHHHATGLNTDEIYQLGQYFSQQKRTSKDPLKPQMLKATHE